MNYYKHNIGDYRRDTNHLSLLEHGIFRQMLDQYYLDEKPLEADKNKLMRSLGIRTDNEREAFNLVLSDFFIISHDGYKHKRCERDLVEIYEKSEKARASAKCRWNKGKNANAPKTDSERNANGMLPNTDNPLPTTDNKDINTTSDSIESTLRNACPISKIVDLYHEKLPELPKVEKVTAKRKGYIQQRWREDLPKIENWGYYFDYVRDSSFLMGKTEPTNGRKPFIANLEWLTNPSNYTKVLEEKYHG